MAVSELQILLHCNIDFFLKRIFVPHQPLCKTLLRAGIWLQRFYWQAACSAVLQTKGSYVKQQLSMNPILVHYTCRERVYSSTRFSKIYFIIFLLEKAASDFTYFMNGLIHRRNSTKTFSCFLFLCLPYTGILPMEEYAHPAHTCLR